MILLYCKLRVFREEVFCNQGSVQISLEIKSVEGLARAYARAFQPSFWFFAVTSVTQVQKKGGISRKMKRWKRRLSMMWRIKREGFTLNIVITCCLLGYCCRTVTLVTAKTIKLLLYARTREDFCVLSYCCSRIGFSACSKRTSPSFYEKQVVVLWKVTRRFVKNKPSFYEKWYIVWEGLSNRFDEKKALLVESTMGFSYYNR